MPMTNKVEKEAHRGFGRGRELRRDSHKCTFQAAPQAVARRPDALQRASQTCGSGARSRQRVPTTAPPIFISKFLEIMIRPRFRSCQGLTHVSRLWQAPSLREGRSTGPFASMHSGPPVIEGRSTASATVDSGQSRRKVQQWEKKGCIIRIGTPSSLTAS